MKALAALVAALALAMQPTALTAQGQGSRAAFAHAQLPDPADEAAARALIEELRCLTCQSQSIADSDAPIAGDMRHEVRSRIAAGQSPDQVRGWLIERYGDYVTYAPQISRTTWPLFAIPVLLALFAGATLWRRLKRRERTAGGAGA